MNDDKMSLKDLLLEALDMRRPGVARPDVTAADLAAMEASLRAAGRGDSEAEAKRKHKAGVSALRTAAKMKGSRRYPRWRISRR